ncbi:MAG: tetratricopeptide repeat protein [Bacteroidales bacterium]|nr:tetratricopeptide repeat protein [Bacteroidales bacterium]
MIFSAIQARNKFFLASIVMLLVVLCVGASSCSTKKNTFINRNYHNLTAHYNVYWNGNDALVEGYKEFQKNVKDNYTGILPVYNTGNIQEAGLMNASADRALEKGSATIQRHSMFIDRKERCKWIDDAYLMMGKAYFYKREYNSAKRTFEFVIAHFDDPKITFQSRLWLVHTLDKTEKFNISATELELARLMIDQGQVGKRKELSFYHETAANHFILMKEYRTALPFLRNAIQYAQTTKMRRRLQFISGQIHQHLEEYQKASEYYARLVKKNTTFEIGFNSRINLAKCYAAGSGDQRTIVAQLNKMLREKRYNDYRDQIYYALYEIAHRNEDIASEKDYLRKSVATSVQNDYQKSLSALTLASILFDERDYETSQAYYDTTLQVLPKDYPDYENIRARGAILTDLVVNLITIREQDSLQRVAGMPERERMAVIDGIIRAIIEEEKRLEEEERRITELGYRDPRYQENQQNTGSWYFYNPQTVAMGRKEFTRKFGARKLEDLWIISNKQSFDWGGNDEIITLGPDGMPVEDTTSFETDVKKREYYLQNLPLTPELRRASDSMIIVSYFNAGNIYRDRLHEPVRAADMYGELIERYPDTTTNKYLLLTYYLIIKCYAELGDDVNRQKYTDMLVGKYPDSDVARLILDPDYYKDMEARAKSVGVLYEKTYLAYKGNQHYVVLINAERANAEFPNDALIPKFDFLKAMSSGSLISRDSTVAQLRRLIVKYPHSEIKPRAEEVYALLTGKPIELTKEEQAISALILEENEISIFQAEQIENTAQLLIIYLPDVYNSNAIRIRISDFNGQNYKVSNLSVNNVMFDREKGMVTVGIFANKDAAMKYYYHILSDNYVMGLVRAQQGVEVMVISAENYPIFYQDQNVSKYKSFFEKNYL